MDPISQTGPETSYPLEYARPSPSHNQFPRIVGWLFLIAAIVLAFLILELPFWFHLDVVQH